MKDLGIIETWKHRFGRADYSHGRDLNDSGVVVGNAAAGIQKGWFANHAFSEAGQGMVDWGTLGKKELFSQAFSINATGDVIGTASLNGSFLSFLYTDNFGMVELEPLITNVPANTNITARQINNAGEISGTISLASGFVAAFLLTPNP
ncbi:MAG: hypothetical protein IH899_14675 [Planctomycetes bacterium]|nr:hypothetical protein [Planctomycetota bacterium]